MDKYGYNDAETITQIQEHLRKGGIVVLATYTKATQYDRRHVDMFRTGSDGSPLVQRGKHWDNIRYTAVRLYTAKVQS